MKNNFFSYNKLETPIHELSGLTKLLSFLLLTFAVMLTFDYRVILGIFIFSLIMFYFSKIEFRQIKAIIYFLVVFMVINALLTFLFEPEYGVSIFGTRHVIIQFTERYVLTQEQVVYQLIKVLKYMAVIPFGILFIATTNPSELAASMNKIGISYRVGTAVSLTLRYFPDIIRAYTDISNSLQARGLNVSKDDKLIERVKNNFTIMVPLIFSSFDRVEMIANAMDLRSFGYAKSRTWYAYRPLQRNDYLALALSIAIFVFSIVMTVVVNQGRYYNPFI